MRQPAKAPVTIEQAQTPPRGAFDAIGSPDIEVSPPDPRLANLAALAGASAIALAALAMVVSGTPATGASARPLNAAPLLAIGLLGVFVLLWSQPQTRVRRILGIACALAAALITGASVVHIASGIGGLVPSPIAGMALALPAPLALPMSPITTIVFTLLIASIVLVMWRSSLANSCRIVLLIAALATSGSVLLAQIYDFDTLYAHVRSLQYPLPVALGQVALSLGLVLANADTRKSGQYSVYSLLTRPSRHILMVVGPLSIVLGALAARAEAHNMLEPGMALATATVTTIILLGIVLSRNTHVLQLRTRQRDTAQTALGQSEARLRLAQAAAGIATVDWDIAADHAVWSSNFVDVFGIQDALQGELQGELRSAKSPYELFIDLVHPDDRARIDAMHLVLLKQGGTFSEEFRITRPDGEIRWIATRGEVLCDARNIPRRLIGSNFDITERRRSEDQLKQSLAIIELANEAGEIGVWNNDIIAGRGTWDERARKIFGLQTQSARINFGQFKRAIHPDDLARVREHLSRALRSGEKFEIECRVAPADADQRWVRIRGLAELDARTRRALRMTGIVFDITERRQREAHLRYLMRELTHRSKNLLAIIQAMARQTGGAAASLEDFQLRFAARLQGMSASHDLLVNENWQGAYLTDIVRAQVGNFIDRSDKRIRVSGLHLQLKPEAAQNIGMALHELSSNAAKYGALANATGLIDVSWTITDAGSGDSRLKLVWRESGGPPVEPPVRRGFGSTVTERIVARALEAHVALSFDPGGVAWTLEIPASYILPAQMPMLQPLH